MPMTADVSTTPQVNKNLKHRAVRGGAFTFAAQWTRFVLRIASTAILSRLLIKDDFGLVAMVTAFTGFASLFAEAGLTQAATRAKDLTREQASSLFWINLGAGTVIAGVAAASAPLLAWFYDEPRLTLLAVVASVSLVIGALGAQHIAMLQRELLFGKLAIVETIGNLLGVVFAVVMAWYGFGFWALVAQLVITRLATTVAAWSVTGWRPYMPRIAPGTRSLLTTGTHLSGTELLNYICVNADAVILGKFSGPGPLGEYSRAQGLLMMPLSQIIAPFTRVAVPLLSRVQDQPERFRRAYYRMCALVALVSTPLIAFLMVGARDIVLIVLGQEFADAAVLFQILAIASWGMPIAATATWVAIATGQTKELFWRNLIRVLGFVAAFLVGVQWGAAGVAWGYVIMTHVMRLPMTWWTLRDTPVSLLGVTKATVPARVIGVVAAATMAVPAYLLPLPQPWISLAATLFVGLLVTGAMLGVWPRARAEMREALDLIRSARRKAPSAEGERAAREEAKLDPELRDIADGTP
ncbi:MAG: lipopolysaccharide biosynthesis protein [Phycisphaerae bacterium]|nr:lipopolysaccharide biosynthesis protein [Phycisphaerae bacterium]